MIRTSAMMTTTYIAALPSWNAPRYLRLRVYLRPIVFAPFDAARFLTDIPQVEWKTGLEPVPPTLSGKMVL